MKKRISVSIDKKLLEKVDETRGRVPRSAFIEEALEEKLTGTHILEGRQ